LSIHESFVRLLRSQGAIHRAGKDFGADARLCDAVADAFDDFARYVERMAPPAPPVDCDECGGHGGGHIYPCSRFDWKCRHGMDPRDNDKHHEQFCWTVEACWNMSEPRPTPDNSKGEK
jgi:hypothetical protein